MPKGARGISDTVWEQLRRLHTPDGLLQIVDFDLPDVISGDEKKDPRDKAGGNTVELVRGIKPVSTTPQEIYVTSLFTYAWKPVHQAVAYYKKTFPQAKVVVGGIYATLMPEHAALSGADEIHRGLYEEAEDLLPDYSLVPGWRQSIVFSHRGCVNRCPYCAVPIMEPSVGEIKVKSIRHLIAAGHRKIILWDNNLLGATNWRDLIAELKEIGLPVDFNQGLDARRITKDVAQEFKGLRIDPIRMAYDIP